MIKKYIQLIKPGYVFANLFTAIAGFFLASQSFSFPLFAATMTAIGLGMASACVMNNYIDRGIDSKMGRTKKRVLVTGEISVRNALIFAGLLAAISVGLFIFYTNLTTLIFGAVGLFFYLVLYSISKRRSPWSTLIGTVPGAVVPVAAYTAVSGTLDLTAVLLFLILVCWQMPHFYAIAIYRRKEYEDAHLPVLTVADGIKMTKVQMLFFTVAFAVVALLLPMTTYLGIIYYIIMAIISVAWIVYATRGFFMDNVNYWARKMFFISLIVNMTWCITVVGSYFFV